MTKKLRNNLESLLGEIRYDIIWSGRWVNDDWLKLHEGIDAQEADKARRYLRFQLAILNEIGEVFLNRPIEPIGVLIYRKARYMECAKDFQSFDQPGNDEIYPITFWSEDLEPLSKTQLRSLRKNS